MSSDAHNRTADDWREAVGTTRAKVVQSIQDMREKKRLLEAEIAKADGGLMVIDTIVHTASANAEKRERPDE